MIKIYKKITNLIMARLYHGELSTSFLCLAALMMTLAFMLSFYVFLNLSGDSVPKSLISSVPPNSKSQRLLAVHVLDIGQGDAIYIEAPNKNSMLIDSGSPDQKVIAEIQKFKNIFDRRLNVLLITHADADHIGSMKKVIEKFAYQIFAYSGLSSDTKLFQDLISTVTAKSSGQNGAHEKDQSAMQKQLPKNLVLTSGMSIVLDDGDSQDYSSTHSSPIKFDVLFPDSDFQIDAYQNCKTTEAVKFAAKRSKGEAKSKSKIMPSSKSKTKASKKDPCLKFLNTETNLNSIVGRLSYGSTSFMLTGDSPIEIEKFIIEKYGNLRSPKYIHPIDLHVDVLKLGHHGSKTSTSPEYLEALSPEFAAISVGQGNRYGHPNKSVLDNIEAFANTHADFQKVLRTDTDGTITFYSDGGTVTERASK